MCGKESRHCLNCNSKNYPKFDYYSCAQNYRYISIHFPRDKAICMKKDTYFKIKLQK